MASLSWSAACQDDLSQAGAIPLLVGLLKTGASWGVHAEAARAVQSLAGNKDLQHKLASAIPLLIKLLNSTSAGAQERAAGAVLSLQQHGERNEVKLTEAGVIPALVTLLRSSSTVAQARAAKAIRNLAGDDAVRQQALADAGVIPPLVELLSWPSQEVQERAAGAVRNLAAHAGNQILLAKHGAIRPLVRLLGSGSRRVQARAAQAVANLAQDPRLPDRPAGCWSSDAAGGVAAVELGVGPGGVCGGALRAQQQRDGPGGAQQGEHCAKARGPIAVPGGSCADLCSKDRAEACRIDGKGGSTGCWGCLAAAQAAEVRTAGGE